MLETGRWLVESGRWLFLGTGQWLVWRTEPLSFLMDQSAAQVPDHDQLTIEQQTAMRSPPLFPVGITDYKRIIQSGMAVVDKSLAIEFLLKKLDDDLLHLLLPSKFGKSLFLSMFAEFLSHRGDPTIFDGTQLGEKLRCDKYLQEHHNNYFVFSLSLVGSLKVKSWEEMKTLFNSILLEEVGKVLSEAKNVPTDEINVELLTDIKEKLKQKQFDIGTLI